MRKRRNADDRLRALERAFYTSPTKSNLQLLMHEMARTKDYSRLVAALQRYIGASCEARLGDAFWNDFKRRRDYGGEKSFLQEALQHMRRRMAADRHKGVRRIAGGSGPKRKTIACIKKLMDIFDVKPDTLEPYAWPGGYQIHGGPELSLTDVVTACNECATEEVDKGAGVTWFLSEEEYEHCEYCEKRLGGDYIDEGETCSECGGDHNSQDCDTFTEDEEDEA